MYLILEVIVTIIEGICWHTRCASIFFALHFLNLLTLLDWFGRSDRFYCGSRSTFIHALVEDCKYLEASTMNADLQKLTPGVLRNRSGLICQRISFDNRHKFPSDLEHESNSLLLHNHLQPHQVLGAHARIALSSVDHTDIPHENKPGPVVQLGDPSPALAFQVAPSKLVGYLSTSVVFFLNQLIFVLQVN
jgi:hypothetical protein